MRKLGSRFPRPLRRWAAGSAATILTLTAMAGSTAAHAPDPFFASGPFGQNQVLQYRWRGGAEPSSVIKAAITAAAADANASRASKAATFAYNAAGSNPIGYGVGATCGVNGLACFTRDVPSGFTIWLREQGHAYDWGTLKWCQAYSSPPNGCYDAESITLDELGHVEGLDHHVNYADDSDYLDAVVQTYSRTKPSAGWNAHAFGRCDIATLQMFYDMLNTSARYSTCLDMNTVLTLSASPALIAPYKTSTFTASLKVYDADPYRLLGGNLVSGRTVTLQRRAPGATTWTSVGSMSAGSAAGTYVLNQQLSATTDFRAVFGTPSTEGINGSTSPAIRVYVSNCTASFVGIRPDGPCP